MTLSAASGHRMIHVGKDLQERKDLHFFLHVRCVGSVIYNSKVILCFLSAINTKGFWLNCSLRDRCYDHFYNGNKLLNIKTNHIDVCRLQALRLEQVYPSGNISTFLASLCSFLELRIITGQDEHRFKLSTIRPHLCLTAINSSQFPTCTLTSPILTQCCWSKQNRYPRALCPTSLPCLGFGKLGETSALTKDKLLGVLQIRLKEISFSIIGNFTCFPCSIFDIFSPLSITVAFSGKWPWIKSAVTGLRFTFRTWLKGELWMNFLGHGFGRPKGSTIISCLPQVTTIFWRKSLIQVKQLLLSSSLSFLVLFQRNAQYAFHKRTSSN